MNPTRCACCHRYAPKALVVAQDGQRAQGDPVGECVGNQAIEEARALARLWRARALRAGWVKPVRCATGTNNPEAARHVAEVRAEIAITPEPGHALAASRTFTIPKERTLKEKTADHLADCIAQGKPLIYCQGPERHHAVMDSPMGEQMMARGCFFCDAYPEAPA